MSRNPDPPNGHAHSSESQHRPKGILKNTNSFQSPSPALSAIPSDPSLPAPENESMSVDDVNPRRPSLPHTASEKEIVAANTRANAGPRRNSSNTHSQPGSRRQSSAMEVDHNASVKFDEVELFQHDQQRGNKMTIDEPKTPFVHGTADPDLGDEDDTIAPDSVGNSGDLLVDELDQRKAKPGPIPDLDLGEPEDNDLPVSGGEKRVVVGENGVEESITGHGEKSEDEMTNAEINKHKRFEELRKEHYRIPPKVLAHAEDEMDE
ncbi:hypothetical protein FH972_024603 [Carpinus fangiana]|uniref:Glc8 protein n=1 Tax=Carpinus fangiana TaxID=176857 RepID=A0A5N6KYG4_9ROSI|nr:hypothetical protein FH972_024603 [Carpinus fangiana]